MPARTTIAGSGDFHLDAQGRITGRRKPGRVAPFVYTGVQILSPRVIRDWPEGPFSTMLFWERAIEAGRAYGFVHQGLWFDVGTPPAIAKTEALLDRCLSAASRSSRSPRSARSRTRSSPG